MFVSRTSLRVEWGDCDPAHIVFYPQYLKWFDACTTGLFKNAGLPLPDLFIEQGILGIPIVDLKARFIIPSRFADELLAESRILEWRRSSFLIEHRFFKGDKLAVEGIETRVWTATDPNNPESIESRPIPKRIIEMLSALGP